MSYRITGLTPKYVNGRKVMEVRAGGKVKLAVVALIAVTLGLVATHRAAYSQEAKMDALNDSLQTKLIKRGISLLTLEYKPREPAFGGSVRQNILVQAGISKEEIIGQRKDSQY